MPIKIRAIRVEVADILYQYKIDSSFGGNIIRLIGTKVHKIFQIP